MLPTKENPIKFSENQMKPIHTHFPLRFDYVDICINHRKLIEKVNIQVPKGKKICITGFNGTGKSTLLNYVIERQEGVVLSSKVKLGYLNQTMPFQLEKNNETIMCYCQRISPLHENLLKKLLAKMKFRGTDLRKEVNQLSGGERIRLSLLLLFIQDYNFLVLDEPTTYLDIESIEALEEFIKSHPATMLIASHDHQFIENIKDELYEIKNCKLDCIK